MRSSKRVFFTDKGPRPAASYSQAVIFDRSVFVSGQVALDPSTGQLVKGTIEEEAERALENLRIILEEAGSSLARALKVTVFLADIADYRAFNEVYTRYFPSEPLARTAVQAGALPMGVRVEIDAIAAL